jgi:hypothetical protein
MRERVTALHRLSRLRLREVPARGSPIVPFIPSEYPPNCRIGRLDAMDGDPKASLPSPAPDVVSRRLGDEIVLVHLKTNRIFSLSPTGARLWELLSHGESRQDIEAALLREYDASQDEVSAEIDSLLGMLRAESLVREG